MTALSAKTDSHRCKYRRSRLRRRHSLREFKRIPAVDSDGRRRGAAHKRVGVLTSLALALVSKKPGGRLVGKAVPTHIGRSRPIG